MNAYKKLEQCFIKLEATMMISGGGSAGAQALATLKGVQHDTLSDPANMDLIDRAKNERNKDPWQKANLYWMEKRIKENNCLPKQLVQALKSSAIESEQAWRRYRAENNWQDFIPHLEKTFQLAKESAGIRADLNKLSIYDALIDEHCPGMTQTTIDPIFNRLKTELPPRIENIIEVQRSQSIIEPKGPFDIKKQQAVGKNLMTAIGFDFNHGRLDTSHHPFCGGVPEDIRITTRYREDEFTSALLGICHETGHALYEQGLPKTWRQQPVGQALGMAVHESQSLIIEMDACRSQEFMSYLAKQLQQQFGNDPAFEPGNLYRLHTQVKRSLIRVDADEVTYPLHVLLRYEIEKDLLNEKIRIQDLPDIWNDKMTTYLEISTKNNFKDGVMQDVHWPSGTFGYFPAYTLGRLMAAQLFASALKAHPNIKNDIANGNFSTLNQWLHENVHTRGSLVNNKTLLDDATGESLNPNYFLKHIEARYQ